MTIQDASEKASLRILEMAEDLIRRYRGPYGALLSAEPSLARAEAAGLDDRIVHWRGVVAVLRALVQVAS